MNTTRRNNLPFVLFQVKGSLFAIASGCVQEIVMMPPVTAVPQTPPEVRGVINLRGKIVELIDLRVKFGLPPFQVEIDDLIQLLREREQDHRDWMAELETCVRERRRFNMQRDPHKCKFGQWYDRFKTEDRLLNMTLPSMDEPHKAIHATADEALRQADSGHPDAALELIAGRRNRELAALIKLFAESRRVLTDGHHEMAIVLSRGADHLAFSADLVEEVERIPEERITPIPASLAAFSSGLCGQVGRRLKTNQTILILDEDLLFSFTKVN